MCAVGGTIILIFLILVGYKKIKECQMNKKPYANLTYISKFRHFYYIYKTCPSKVLKNIMSALFHSLEERDATRVILENRKFPVYSPLYYQFL